MATEEEDPVYCVCRLPYDETRFMIECDVCKDWFHGSCVGVQEHQAADIEIYHCPKCTPKHGPLVLKHRRNWHRHDYSEDSRKVSSAVQTGTAVFIKQLKSRTFPSADEIPIKQLLGAQLTPEYVEEAGFDVPILCVKKDGLGLTLPSPSITIQEIEQLVGPMREIDVIDVARQDDIKMTMREWIEYYNSPNRVKILNVISLEFSNTELSEYVVPPKIVRQLSWARNVWPEQLPEDSTRARPEVQKYCLMGVKDSFTDFHIDFGGTSVWYHVLRGEKVFYLIKPTQKNLMLYEKWLSSSKQSELFFGDQVDHCYQMVVKEGHTLFVPTGWIHAVLTPLDSLVFGGNFLHNFNIRLQLQCYEIERTVKTPEKYLFPSYEIINWYAAKNILDMLQEYTEEAKLPPHYLADGARALLESLRSWTQRKDYAKVGKQDVTDYIQYGKLLKDMQKEVKKIDAMEKTTSPKKQDNRRRKADKTKTSSKAIPVLDLLDQHTKETLKIAERETRENIYNFKDDEDEPPTSLKVRIPKAGAYVADHENINEISVTKTAARDSKINKKSVDSQGPETATSQQEPSSKKNNKDSKKKKGAPEPIRSLLKENLLQEAVVKTEQGSETVPVKEVPQCLKFKLSNGKMVSTDRKTKCKKFKKKEFLLLGPDLSNSTVPSVKAETDVEDKVQSRLKSPKKEKIKDEPINKKEKIKDETFSKHEKIKVEAANKKDTADVTKSKPAGSDKRKQPRTSQKGKQSGSRGSRSKSAESKLKANSSASSKSVPAAPVPVSSKGSDSDGDHLVVDEAPKKPQGQKTTSTLKPASLKMKLSSGPSQDDSAGKNDTDPSFQLDMIRGGLNGSISDILTASGYGTETTFRVDTDASGMRDAIAGMLTMSGMGGGDNLFTATDGSGNKNNSAVDEEEELMADCYRDSEFVYPSFELSDEEEESIYKARKKAEKDDNWNPKARIEPGSVKVDREHRVGVQKESLASTLATTAAKLAEHPPVERKFLKKSAKPKVPEKKEFEVQPLPGPSSVLDEPVNAFRPGIKRPVDPCAGVSSQDPSKSKKPKKGLATAKQRLGKLLKIKKIVF
ncbi:hypothetical protein BsWGS_13645 [Bradybaena similaris]